VADATRRELVGRGALLGGLTAAAASAPALRRATAALARTDGDVRVLERAIGLEQTAVFVYGEARRSGQLSPALRSAMRLFADQEREHIARLILELERLGGTPPPKPARVAQVAGLGPALAGGRRTILEFAVAREEAIVAAYHRAQRDLLDPKLMQATATMMANAGQHLAALREALGENPVPNAFETGGAG
jgi:hypothetical protein